MNSSRQWAHLPHPTILLLLVVDVGSSGLKRTELLLSLPPSTGIKGMNHHTQPHPLQVIIDIFQAGTIELLKTHNCMSYLFICKLHLLAGGAGGMEGSLGLAVFLSYILL